MKRLNLFLLFLLLFIDIKVFSQITIDFDYTPSNPCVGASITFNPSIQDASSYSWVFGDGTTSTQKTPTHTFNASPGNGTKQFFVQLTARKAGQSGSITKAVDVLLPPDPSLTAPSFSLCSGSTNLALTVTNTSTTSNSNYQIDWGDGGTPYSSNTFASLTNNYTGPNSFDLVFTVTGTNGCTNSKTYTVLIGGQPDIGAAISGSKTGCAPFPVTFEITNTTNNFGTTYMLEFDDGTAPETVTQSNLQTTFVHTFNESTCSQSVAGFTFKVTATNGCGSLWASVGTGVITSEPIAKISASDDTVCVGITLVSFFNNSIPQCGGDPSQTTYEWIIEGNTFTTSDVTYTFNNPGDQTVTFTANNPTSTCSNGLRTTSLPIRVEDSAIPNAPDAPSGPVQVCQGEQGVIFTVPPVPNATTYTWNLPSGATIFSGQGTNTIIVNFDSNAQIGTVEIKVSGGNKCETGTESAPYQFTVNPLPSPAGDIDGVPSLCEGQAVEYTYTIPAINDADDYVWSVPTGATITSGQGSNSITVSFPATGASSGNISVYGTNSCGPGLTSSLYVEVKPIPADAGLLNGPDSVCVGDEVVLTIPQIANADLYVWTLSDGTVVTKPSNIDTLTINSNTTPAIFEVYGANVCGVGAPSQKSIKVNPAPSPNFGPTDHCHGFPAPLIDTTLAVDSTIISWEWNFGDGYESNLEEPSHTYIDSGTYIISLAVESNKGCNSTFDSTITVHPTPEAHHRPIPVRTSIVKPEITFKDSSFFANTFYWDFGDSTSSNEQSPVHAYTKVGDFDVMEVAYSGFGCLDTTYSKVTIYEGVFVPNAFLPGSIGGGGGGAGGDGGDDTGTFKPIFGVAAEGDGFSFMIFSRWGEMVFSTKNVDEGWNGLVRNTGKQAPVGVYAWKLTYKESGTGKIKTRTGNVMLLR